MKNMKKLLSALTALSFVAVAGISTVACRSKQFVEIDKRNKLVDVFSSFQFHDAKNVQGFLDASDSDTITNQILAYLAATSLDEIQLTLENWTSNSITLVAKNDAENYQGAVTLTWNLKLFEVWGLGARARNSDFAQGLKGYFYLEQETSKIKFFDVTNALKGFSTRLHPYFKDYHKFSFINQLNEIKDFTFNGRRWVDNIPKEFGSFNFTPGTKIVTVSPEFKRIKIFNRSSKEWEGLSKATEFIITEFGDMLEHESN